MRLNQPPVGGQTLDTIKQFLCGKTQLCGTRDRENCQYVGGCEFLFWLKPSLKLQSDPMLEICANKVNAGPSDSDRWDYWAPVTLVPHFLFPLFSFTRPRREKFLAHGWSRAAFHYGVTHSARSVQLETGYWEHYWGFNRNVVETADGWRKYIPLFILTKNPLFRIIITGEVMSLWSGHAFILKSSAFLWGHLTFSGQKLKL